MNTLRAILFLAVVSTGITVEKGYSSDYDFTTAAKVRLPDYTGTPELRILPEHMVKRWLCGRYAGFNDHAGYFLYLFPDGGALLEHCELGPIWLAGKGTWKYANGKVSLSWETLRFEDERWEEFYHKRYGSPSEYLFFVAAKKDSLEDPILVSPEKMEPTVRRCYIQQLRYLDWEEDRRETLKHYEAQR